MTKINNPGQVTFLRGRKMVDAVLETVVEQADDVAVRNRAQIEGFHASNQRYSSISTSFIEDTDAASERFNPACFITQVVGNGWKSQLIFLIARNIATAETHHDVLDGINDAIAGIGPMDGDC